jgi:hypothetical protein
MSLGRNWRERSPDRLSDGLWDATINRVRAEFLEMPEMRLTRYQAESLLGLGGPVAGWVFDKLETEGFLSRTSQGEYVRRNPLP